MEVKPRHFTQFSLIIRHSQGSVAEQIKRFSQGTSSPPRRPVHSKSPSPQLPAEIVREDQVCMSSVCACVRVCVIPDVAVQFLTVSKIICPCFQGRFSTSNNCVLCKEDVLDQCVKARIFFMCFQRF